MNPARGSWRVLMLAVAAACAAAPPLLDLDGVPVTPLAVPAGQVHVLVFTSHECPIANAYAPTLRGLAARWREAPVRLFLVHVDPDLSATAARQHAGDYELPGTIVRDGAQRLARQLGITRTPEAVVLTPQGLAYRGRIDDQWRGLGVRAAAASTHDLASAVAATLAGRPPSPPYPEAVGCLLPEAAATRADRP